MASHASEAARYSAGEDYALISAVLAVNDSLQELISLLKEGQHDEDTIRG